MGPSIQVLRRWEPPSAETLLAMNHNKVTLPRASSSVKNWSDASPPPKVAKDKKKDRVTRESTKNAEIIQTVHTALCDAEVDETPRPPRKAVPKQDDFISLVQTYQEDEPGINLWSCTEVLKGRRPRDERYAMIILNQPITRKDVFLRAWNASMLDFLSGAA